MTNPVPPMSEAVKALYDAFIDAFDETAQVYHLKPAEIMVALCAATAMIIRHAATSTGNDPEKLMSVYRDSLRLPPQEET